MFPTTPFLRKSGFISLVPRPIPFFLFAFTTIHESGRLAKDREGLGGWKWVSYWSRRVVSITLRSGVQNCSRALEWMMQCVVLAVGPLPPLRPPHVHLASTSRPPRVHLTSTSRPPHVHLTSFTWWVLPGLPHFHWSSTPVYYCECKQKVKTG